MELEVYNIQGEATGKKVTLDDAIFGIEPNDHTIYLASKYYTANLHRGTHSAKERSQLSGSTKKLKKQKGSGAARYGDIKNPLFRSGARVFGPRPRTYGIKLNKKVKSLARKSVLSYKAKDDFIRVVEDFELDTPKTKNFVEILKNNEWETTRTLFVVNKIQDNVYLSGRNLKNISILTSQNLNAYDVLKAKQLVLTESSVKYINEHFA